MSGNPPESSKSLAPKAPASRRRRLVQVHRWLGLASGLFWLVQALTGMLLTFHFEIQDAALGTGNRPTDFMAMERTIEKLATPASGGKIIWIWTTAGLPDRYVINFSDVHDRGRMAHIDGAGTILRDRSADDLGFLGTARAIHMDLLAGTAGHWILAVTGLLLLTNMIAGVVVALPSRRSWKLAFRPVNKGNAVARLFSWHRAVGLWGVVPALLIAGTGTLIMFEEQIREATGAKEITLPANPPKDTQVGFAVAARTAVAAVPGSQFVGTTMPSPEDASYYAWVRAPSELYRGYGGSLVVVDGNDGSIRGSYPAQDADAAYAFIGSLYPLHTGEFLGTTGRILALFTGLWLAATIMIGVLLWQRRRRGIQRRSSVASPRG